MNRRNKKIRILVLILAFLLVAALVIPLFAGAISAAEEEGAPALTAEEVVEESEEEPLAAETAISTAQQGVFIENINTAGMSLAEIEAAVAAKMEEYRQDKIILYTDIEQVEVPAGDLGLYYANTDIAREAYSIGKSGNIYKRFLSDHRLQSEPIILDLELHVPEEDVRVAVENAKSRLDREPKATSLKRESDGSFTIFEKVDGATVDANTSAANLFTYMNEVWHGGEGGMELQYTLIPAVDETERLKAVGDLLGSFTTEYPTEIEGRVTNIELATSFVNGLVLFPDEEFSFADVVGPTTEEAGFRLAGAYESGAVVQEYGGGICQVSSTLYMAALFSELEITERYPHTMTVNYLSPGMDAVINEGTFNFRFRNSLPDPIYIEGIASEGQLTISIYGKETRAAGRSLQFESRTLSTEIRPNQYYTRSDMPVGEIELQEGRDGMQVELWKLIYQDGEYQTEEKVNDSAYYVYADKFMIGTDGITSEQLNDLQKAILEDDVNGVYNAVKIYY